VTAIVKWSGSPVLEGRHSARVVANVQKVARLVVTPVKDTPGGWVTVAPGVQFVPTTGRYRARASAPGGKRVSAGAATREEAIALQAALELKLATLGETATEVSVRAWVTTWLDRRAAAGVRSVRSEKDRARKHLYVAKFANKSLGDLRRSDVLAWIRELKSTRVDSEGQRVGWARKKAAEDKASGKAPKRRKRRRGGIAVKILSLQTIRHCLKLLRGALAAGVDEELISQNPALGIKLPKENRVDEGWSVLSLDELARVLEAAPIPERYMIEVAAWTGMRLGELCALETSDVHLDAAVPHIVVRYGAAGHKPTKSGRPRTIPLVQPAIEAFRKWTTACESWVEWKRHLVFPTKRGYHRSKPPKEWRKWLRASGVFRRVRWHDLRHTCASFLLSGAVGRRWSMAELKEMLGHASVTTTERYAHFARSALFDAARESNMMITAASNSKVP
jgi:integrase